MLDDALRVDLPDGAKLPWTAGTFAVPKRMAHKPIAATKAGLMLIASRELPERGKTARDRIAQNVVWI